MDYDNDADLALWFACADSEDDLRRAGNEMPDDLPLDPDHDGGRDG